MSRPLLVISTVGTSLLTNQIDRDTDPDRWSKRIQETANYTSKDVKSYEDVLHIVTELKERTEKKLFGDNSEIEEIREASAELNGIYGLYKLYDKQLEQGKSDIHWLIATDTYQGQVTANIVKTFLQKKGLVADIYTPNQLSTVSTESFSSGIDELLKWLDEIILGYQAQASYQICFNLVGGFKALQGYANTIGMIYGVEIVYVFENSFEVIKIPRLPIQIDYSVIQPVEFALMASNASVWIKRSELQKVPESLIFTVGDEATLSNWGRLIWNKCKLKFFKGDLLVFPRLVYEKSFVNDYQHKNVDDKNKFELQQVLAEVSASMLKFNGDTTRFDSRLNFSRYQGGKIKHIDHFYIKNTGWRVSCIAKDGNLHLRHYGEHDYVNNNP